MVNGSEKIGIMTESSVYNNTNNVRVTNFNEGDAIRINISGTVNVPAEGVQIRFKNLRWKYYEEGDENIPDVVDDEITVRIDNNRNVIMDNVDSSASSLILKYLDENDNIITILDNIGESEIMEDPGEPDPEIEITMNNENEISIDNVSDEESLVLKYETENDEPLMEVNNIGETTLNNEEQ